MIWNEFLNNLIGDESFLEYLERLYEPFEGTWQQHHNQMFIEWVNSDDMYFNNQYFYYYLVHRYPEQMNNLKKRISPIPKKDLLF